MMAKLREERLFWANICPQSFIPGLYASHITGDGDDLKWIRKKETSCFEIRNAQQAQAML